MDTELCQDSWAGDHLQGSDNQQWSIDHSAYISLGKALLGTKMALPSALAQGFSAALSPLLALPQAPCSLQGIETGLSYGLIFFILLSPPTSLNFLFHFLFLIPFF